MEEKPQQENSQVETTPKKVATVVPEAPKEPEKPKSQPTILDNLNKLLSPEHEWEIKELYEMMLTNQSVVKTGLKPSLKQFRQYFEQLRRGFEYVKNTYGPETLPKELVVYQGAMNIGSSEKMDWMGYLPEKDHLGISLLHIAGQCTHYDNLLALSGDSHFPKGTGVRTRDYTILQAIEEGYHRYQLNVLGYEPQNTMRDINHPLEKGIIPIFQKAMEDLDIKTYKTFGKATTYE